MRGFGAGQASSAWAVMSAAAGFARYARRSKGGVVDATCDDLHAQLFAGPFRWTPAPAVPVFFCRKRLTI